MQDQEILFELSGEGFSGLDPVVLPMGAAYARLLAEICGNLAPWISFSPSEACETTLFSHGEAALAPFVRKFQRRLAMRFIEKCRENKRAKRSLEASMDTSGTSGVELSAVPPAAPETPSAIAG